MWPKSLVELCRRPDVGELLWVQEAFHCDDYRYPDGPVDEMLSALEYRATHECRGWEAGCPCRDDDDRPSWISGHKMPRWASRICLRITDVRTERLQDVSDEDVLAEARAEGLCPENGTPTTTWFARKWDEIHGKQARLSWADNPWVWRVAFERLVP